MKRKKKGQSHKPHWACHTPVTDVTWALLGRQSLEEEVWQQIRPQQLWPSRPSPFPRSTSAEELGERQRRDEVCSCRRCHEAQLCGSKDLLPVLREAQAPVLEIFLHLGKLDSWKGKLHVGFHSADKEELLTFPVQTTLAFVHVLEPKPRVLCLLIYH